MPPPPPPVPNQHVGGPPPAPSHTHPPPPPGPSVHMHEGPPAQSGHLPAMPPPAPQQGLMAQLPTLQGGAMQVPQAPPSMPMESAQAEAWARQQAVMAQAAQQAQAQTMPTPTMPQMKPMQQPQQQQQAMTMQQQMMVTGQGQASHNGTGQGPEAFRLIMEALRDVMNLVLEGSDSEELNASIMQSIVEERKDIANRLHNKDLLRGHCAEALAAYIKRRVTTLSSLCPAALIHSELVGTAIETRRRLTAAMMAQGQHKHHIFREFLFQFLTGLIHDSHLADLLVMRVLNNVKALEIAETLEYIPSLLAMFMEHMLDIQARTARVAMEFLHRSGVMTLEQAKHSLMTFYQCFTVDTNTATVDVRDSPMDPSFQCSQFRVELIDNFGYLLRFFRVVEEMVTNAQPDQPATIAVDFEGVKLCRHGELCLAQFCCYIDPCTVYVLDVYKLGKEAFTMTNQQGMSVKSILEDESIRKVWFDPRNDVDALYHQFGVQPHGIFDLQIAEVAERRSRGLGVRYVQGLFKCLANCTHPHLTDEHKAFAEKIDILGKNLFEPDNGGSYEVFRQRPLHPIILVYAAHDARHMLMLYETLIGSLNPAWFQRIMAASVHRGNWWRHEIHLEPNSDAPDF